MEYAEYVGNFYGTPKKYVDAAMDEGRDVILDIEIQGAQQVCAKRPETVRIFIAPPSWSELERRLTERGTDDADKVQKRLLRAKVELKMADAYDYFVINDTVDSAVEPAQGHSLGRALQVPSAYCKAAGRVNHLFVRKF